MKQTKTHGSLRKTSEIPRKYSWSIKEEPSYSNEPQPTTPPKHVFQLLRTNHPSLRRRPPPSHHLFPFQRRGRPTTRTYATPQTTNPWTHHLRKQRNPDLSQTLPHSSTTRNHHDHPHPTICQTNTTAPNPTRSSRTKRATPRSQPSNPYHHSLRTS